MAESPGNDTTTFRKVAAGLLLLFGVELWLTLGAGWYGRTWHLIGVVVIVALAAVPPVGRSISRGLDTIRHPSPRARRWIAVAMAAIAIAIFYQTAVLQGRSFLPHVADELSYLVQMRQMAQGRLWREPHPLGPFFESFYLLNGPKYASMYFPGTALMFLPTVPLGLKTWVLPLLASGAVVGLVYRVVAEVVDSVAGLLSGLGMVSLLLFRWLSLRVLSTVPALLLGFALVWAWLHWRRTKGAGWAAAMGALAGWLAITRPLDAVCFALPVAVMVALDLRGAGRRRWAATIACGVLAACPLLAMQAVANKGITGEWFTTPYRVYHDRDVPGSAFGFRAFDAGARPQSILPQKHKYFDDFLRPSIERHRPGLLWQDWTKSRLPLIVSYAVPHRLLLALVPVGLLGLAKPRRWVVFGVLPLFVVLISYFAIFISTYSMIVAPAVVFVIALVPDVLGNSFKSRAIPTAAVAVIAFLELVSLPWFDKLQIAELISDSPEIETLERKLSQLPAPAVVLFKYSPDRIDYEPVYKATVAWPDDAAVIRAHDLGERNPQIFAYYAARDGRRAFYRVDEGKPEADPEYLGTAAELAAHPK